MNGQQLGFLKPKRIQRERRRGWRKPKGSVVVSRGTIYGNPFVVRADLEAGTIISNYPRLVSVRTNEESVLTFREYLRQNPDLVEQAKRRLRGCDLVCWCALDEPYCHADVWIEVVN